jgi:transposase
MYPSKSAIQRFLNGNNYIKRRSELKPPISPENQAKRLAFAKRWMHDGNCTLENVIWTDETRVASHPNNRRISLWTNTGEVPPQVKMHSGGNMVMFWGCISKHGPGPLVSLQGAMDGKEYIKVLKENLLPDLKLAKRTIPGTWRIMQDNAPCHTSKLVKSFLARKNIEFIIWPPYSPDLNPIENIWHWMKHVLETEYPVCVSAEEIEERIFEIWGTIDAEMCSKYCSNYEKRLLAVINSNGGYTKY